jgi:hypothetical protein
VTYAQQTLSFSGLNQPEGVAVDRAGNVFVAWSRPIEPAARA